MYLKVNAPYVAVLVVVIGTAVAFIVGLVFAATITTAVAAILLLILDGAYFPVTRMDIVYNIIYILVYVSIYT